MPLTEAQQAALDAGRSKAHQLQQQETAQRTEPARFTYIARRRLKVGDGWREVGEEVPEASTWPNRQAYLDQGISRKSP